MAATQGNQIRETMVAGADLSAKQFTFVKMNTTDRTVVSAADGDAAFGVLINQPLSGNAATVVTHGRVTVEAGTGGVTAGAKVASDLNGEAIVASATAPADVVVGICITAAAAGELATIDFFRGGNAAA